MEEEYPIHRTGFSIVDVSCIYRIYTCIYVYMHVHTVVYLHTHTHTYIHTWDTSYYIHVHKKSVLLSTCLRSRTLAYSLASPTTTCRRCARPGQVPSICTCKKTSQFFLNHIRHLRIELLVGLFKTTLKTLNVLIDTSPLLSSRVMPS